MTLRRIALLSAALSSLWAGTASAAIVTQWIFNSVPPDASTTTGVTTPSTGTGTLTLVGGVTQTFATGSPSDPAAAGNDNTGLNTAAYPAQGAGSGTAGVQFAASTVGNPGPVQIQLDFRQSATASRFWQLQVSANGTTFTNVSGGMGSILGPINPPNTATSFDNTGLYSNNASATGQTFVQGITYTFAAGSPLENNPNFAFRWLAVFDPQNPGNYTATNAPTSTYSANGTGRFDVVTISAVPEPGSLALVGLAAVGYGARRLRRKTPAAGAMD